MGKLTYDGTTTVNCDDRVLAHLQIAIGAKLRRGECFYFTWRDEFSSPNGINTLWMAPHISLHFKYYGSRVPIINSNWVAALAHCSNTPGGLHIVPEPSDTQQTTQAEV